MGEGPRACCWLAPMPNGGNSPAAYPTVRSPLWLQSIGRALRERGRTVAKNLIFLLVLAWLASGCALSSPGDISYNLGNVYLASGDYDRAIAAYDKALQLNPGDADAYNNRGTAYGHKGDHDRAIADYDQAIRLQPDLAEAYNNRGIAFEAKGDHARALADYDKAIQLKPNNAGAYMNRSIVQRAKGDYGQAIADLEKCRDLAREPALRTAAEQALRDLGAQ
jgi:tetratricopeptide (TPR) repeat protein